MLVFIQFKFGKFRKIHRKTLGVNFGKVFRANRWYLLVQSLWQKYQGNVWNMFINNNKDELWTDFTHCCGVSIVDFEQVNAGWTASLKNSSEQQQF